MLTVDFAVVTFGAEGIERVSSMVLPPVEGVRYVVSWQNSGDISLPYALRRDDISVFRTPTRGISLNRNNALEHCSADIVIFADDDLILYPEAIDQVRAVFEANPSVDVATFRSDHGDPGRFPATEVRLGRRMPKGYYVTSFEITLRRSSAGLLRCCPELGIGSPLLHGGEDEMFLLNAVRRGLDCRFFPITVCSHPHDSTGLKASLTRGNLLASGCIIALTYPSTAFLRVPLKAWRIWRNGQAGLFRAFNSLARGALMAPGLRRRNSGFLS